jgi:hypothetical protein
MVATTSSPVGRRDTWECKSEIERMSTRMRAAQRSAAQRAHAAHQQAGEDDAAVLRGHLKRARPARATSSATNEEPKAERKRCGVAPRRHALHVALHLHVREGLLRARRARGRRVSALASAARGARAKQCITCCGAARLDSVRQDDEAVHVSRVVLHEHLRGGRE